MLQAIHDRSQSFIAYAIVGLLVIPFALWGVQSYFGGGSTLAAAEVNGEEILISDFEGSYNQYRQNQAARLAQLFQGQLNHPAYKAAMDEDNMKKLVIDGLIERRLLTSAAFESGMLVSDAELDKIILQIPHFQNEQKFDAELFKNGVKNLGMSIPGYRAALQNDIVIDQMLQGIQLTAAVTRNALEEQVRLENQQRDMAYVTLPASRYLDSVTVSDADIQQYYEQNISQYQTPERVMINYIELDVKKLAGRVDVSEDQLRNYYNNNKTEFQVDVAVQTAQQVAKRIQSGESFAELAKAHSKDPVSAANGGDLGLVARNIMDKAFEERLFSMQVGEVSEPVKTSFGYHLIKLMAIEGDQRRASHILFTNEDVTNANIRPFDEVRSEIEKQVRLRNAENIFTDMYDQLANLAFENPTTLDVAADELQIKVVTSEPFGREGGTGILSEPKVIEAAFSPEVLENGINSEMLELSDTRIVVLRVKEHNKPQPRPLDEVRALVTSQVKRSKASALAQKTGEEFQQRIIAGESADDLAKTYGYEWKKPGKIDRQNREIDDVLKQALFKMPKPAGKPVYQGLNLRSGDYVLLSLLEVKEGDTSSQDETLKSKTRAALLQDYRQRELSAFKAQLREQADVKIYANNF